MAIDARWYVVHTYSGYEKKVATNIEKMVENRKMQDQILEVKIPTEIVVDAEKKKEVERKLFPGYVLVKVAVTPDKDNRPAMSDETWLLIRNTRGVTGFVGPGSKPVPLTEEEVAFFRVEDGAKEESFKLKEGMKVKAVSGTFAGYSGVLQEISEDKKQLTILVSTGKRDIPIIVETKDVAIDE